MATYYVSKAGNNSHTGLSGSGKLTIAGALAVVDHGDTVEIIDEGSYNEGDLDIDKHRLTVIHTASHLGSPKIHGTGLESTPSTRCFTIAANITGTVLQGLEVHGYTSYFAFKNTTNLRAPLTVSGCFIHSIEDSNCQLYNTNLRGNDDWPDIISDSVIFFPSNAIESGILRADGGRLHIKNTLFTSSHDGRLISDYGGNAVTASFCTFINRRGGSDNAHPLVRASKVINCIVSGSGVNMEGIASDDHTYNLVKVNSNSFMEHDESTVGSTGSGDKAGDPLFNDGTAIGSSSAIAANYKLQSASPAIAAGTAFDNIDTDISGTKRNAQITNWVSYSKQPESNYNNDHVINIYANATSQQKSGPVSTNVGYSMGAFEQEIAGGNYDGPLNQPPGQVQFSLSAKGPANLRQRSIPYCTTRGSDPSTTIVTGSG